MARKPTPTISPVDTQELDTNKINEITNLGASLSAESNKDFALLNQVLGQGQMADAFAKISKTVFASKLAYIKENKLYRALAGQKNEFGLQFKGTWEEYCELLGWTPQHANEAINNLRSFGEEALESMSHMGVGYREMRQFRSLPNDSKQTLIEVAKTGDRDSFLDLAEEMIRKHAEEKESLRKKQEQSDAENAAERERLQKGLDEVKADYEAIGQRLQKKNQELEAAQFALDRAEHRLKIATPDEQFADLRDECHVVASRVEDEFRTALTAALEALQEHGQANEEDLTPWMSSLILRMQRQLDAVRLKFGLPDVLEGEEPSWLNPDAVAAIEADVEARLASKEA